MPFSKMKFFRTNKKLLPFFLVGIVAIIIMACSNEDDPDNPAVPANTNKTSGFIITGTTSSDNALVKYFEDIPTETVDLSDGTDFIQFLPTSIYDHSIYLARPDDLPGFAKMVVNDNGELEEVGVIPTVDDGSFRIAVRDGNTGVFQDRATPDIITVFNPGTLEITGTIDMSAGMDPNDVDSRYQRFIFRGEDIFSPIRENVTGDLYSGFYLHQASLTSNNFVDDTGVDSPFSGGVLTVNNFGQGLVDANGDLYVQDGGAIGSGTFSRIYKIPAGSNGIDTNYVFEPVKIIAPDNIFYPTLNGFKIVAPGKAIARVNGAVPQAAIDIILGLPGDTIAEKIGALRQDPDALNQVLGVLFTAESAIWCELDLNTQTVTAIVGAPQVGVNSGGSNVFEHNGEIYFPIATASEQAFYKYSPGTPSATKAFDVTGADLATGYNLANNN